MNERGACIVSSNSIPHIVIPFLISTETNNTKHHHQQHHTNNSTRVYDMRHILPIDLALFVAEPLTTPALFPYLTQEMSPYGFVATMSGLFTPVAVEVTDTRGTRCVVFVHT